MSHRIDVNELAARLALTIDTPVALPPAWVAKHSEGLGGQIIARNLLAVLVIGTDRRWYSVAGTPAKACLTIETSAAAVSILLNGHDGRIYALWTAATDYYVLIIDSESEKVVMGPMTARRADRVDDGANINLNHAGVSW